MSSFDSIMFQLTSGLISETSMPEQYLYNKEIIDTIKRFNWTILASTVQGWVNLRKIVNYSS